MTLTSNLYHIPILIGNALIKIFQNLKERIKMKQIFDIARCISFVCEQHTLYNYKVRCV